MIVREYDIFADNLGEAQKAVDKVNKRAAKLDLDPMTLTVVDEFMYENPSTKETFKKYKVELCGDVPKLADWTFFAVIQHTGEGNIIRVVPGQDEADYDLTSYRQGEAYCDHCKLVRRRNDTYLVRHDDGTFMQVGSNCMKDFTGVDPSTAVAMAGWFSDLEAAFSAYEDDFIGGSSGTRYIRTVEYLGWVALAIRDNGWLPRSKAYDGLPTADHASEMMWKPSNYNLTPDSWTEYEDEATAAIEWAQEIPVDTENDYLYNLRVVARNEWITYREYGLVASLIPAYRREQEREIQLRKRREDSNSEWIGEIKQRINLDVTVTGVRFYEGRFGVTFITNMIDEDGNEFVWFASRELTPDTHYVGKGTVKDHNEYKGIKQTQVTRCKLEEV